MRMIRLLVGRPPQPIAQLVSAAGVTRTAVTEQLNELVDAGFVRRTLERTGRGRPRYRYEVTETALAVLFANNQRLLAPALLRAMTEICGSELSCKVLNRVSESLAEHYKGRISAEQPHERLRQLAQVLQDEGVLVDFEESNGRYALHERTCPYVDMIDQERSVCAVEQQMMEQVTGAPIKAIACRLDGCPGCTFELETSSPADR
ncbi:MAG: helix-turn-helix transcriptional regulator [Pirellulales bacterium]